MRRRADRTPLHRLPRRLDDNVRPTASLQDPALRELNTPCNCVRFEYDRDLCGPVSADVSQLVERLGRSRVLTGSSIPPRYQTDAFRAHRGSLLEENRPPPAAVVLPPSVDEVVTVVRFVVEAGLKLVPWGGGTGLMGGARPTFDSIVLDLRNMRRVRSIDAASCTATVEAGIVLEPLDRRLRKRGLTLGPEPWSRPRATVGGAIGTNGIGYAGYLRGTMGDQVLGLEAVLANGSVIRTRPAARSTTGLDLKRLFIG